MARLKTKQISDFTTAVQTLIDNDADQNAGLIDALEASVDSLESVAGGTVTADLTASVDSLETYADGISSDLAAEILATNGDVTNINASIDSIEVDATALTGIVGNHTDSIDSLETALGNEISATNGDVTAINASVDSLEAVAGGTVTADLTASVDSLETVAGDNATAISNMLSGSSLDLDTFAEIVSFVESVDTVNDGIVSNLTSQTGASVDSLEIQVGAVETLNGNQNASIDSLETALGNEISATNGDVTAINASVDSLEAVAGGTVTADLTASVDSLETALSGEISATDGEITAINASINSLELYDLVFEQAGTFVGPTQFTVGAPVKFGGNDDLLVFINGQNIHKNGTFEGVTEGYETADGATFDLISIGYNIDANDHVTVVGIRQ